MRYLRVLRCPGTMRVLAPTLVARIPDSIAATAIVVVVRSVTGSYSAAGLAAGAFGIGTAVSAPLTGRAADRLGQRRVLPVLAAAFAAALITLVLVSGLRSGAAAVVLAAAAGLTRPPLEAALRALWPRLVPAAQLDAAYALDSTVQELIWIVGPLLLAVLLTVGSPGLALIACAVLSMAGTAVYAVNLRAAPGARSTRAAPGSPLRQARLRLLLACGGCYGVSAGMLNLALVAFAGVHGGVAWAGVMVAIWGAGSLAGGLAYGSRNWKAPVEARAMICLALFGATLMLLAAAPGLIVLAVLMVFLGLPLSPWLGSLSACIHRVVPAAAATEAFAWSFAVITAGMAAGNAIGGLVIQHANPQTAFITAGALSLAGALYGGTQLPMRRHQEQARPQGHDSHPTAGSRERKCALAGMTGKKRLGCFCALPVCRCGCPVECRPLAVTVLFLVGWCRRVLVLGGSAVVRLGCPQEGLNTGGKSLLRRGLGDGRVVLRFDELLGGGHRVLLVPPGLPQFINARTDGGNALADLTAAGLPAL